MTDLYPQTHQSRARGSLRFVQLHLPGVVQPEQARSALVALAGISRQPRIVLEAIGHQGRISWWLGADQDALPRILRALTPHLPGLRTDEPRDMGIYLTDAARIRLPGHRTSSLRRGVGLAERDRRLTAVSRGVLGALAATRHGEVVLLQLILGPRRRPVAPDVTPPTSALSLLIHGAPKPRLASQTATVQAQ